VEILLPATTVLTVVVLAGVLVADDSSCCRDVQGAGGGEGGKERGRDGGRLDGGGEKLFCRVLQLTLSNCTSTIAAVPVACTSRVLAISAISAVSAAAAVASLFVVVAGR